MKIIRTYTDQNAGLIVYHNNWNFEAPSRVEIISLTQSEKDCVIQNSLKTQISFDPFLKK